MIVVDDIPASERFFAGGDTTVRGFALDRLGTPETIDRRRVPARRSWRVVLNAEARVPVRGGLGVVGVHRRRQRVAHRRGDGSRARCAARWGSACAIDRRLDRFVSTSASSWIDGRCRRASGNGGQRCTFHLGRRSDVRLTTDRAESREQRAENAASHRRGFLLSALCSLLCQRQMQRSSTAFSRYCPDRSSRCPT